MDADRSHRRGRISVLAALVAASACLAGAVPAAADSGPTWTPFVGISPLGFFTQGATAAAANAEGDELIAWVLGSMDIYYVRRSAGGEFSDPVHLDAWGDDPQPSLNAHGDALVMWNSGLKGATGTLIPAGGDPESFAVSTGSEDSTAMYSLGGIADDGTITVFWTDVGQIWYSRRPPGGSFAKPKAVPNPGTWANGLSAKVGPDGSAVLTWGSGTTEYVSTAPAHSGFTTIALSSADDPSALDHDTLLNGADGGGVLMNAEGDAVVFWEQPRNHSRETDELAAVRLAGHSFSTPQTLLAGSPLGGASMGIGPDGAATMIWTGSAKPPGSSSSKPGVWMAQSSTDGVFAPAELISQQHGCIPAVTVAPDGTTYAVWNEYDGQPVSGCQGAVPHEYAAVRAPGADGFSDPVSLDSGGDIAGPPRVVASGQSGALAAWVLGTQPNFFQVEYSTTDGQFGQTAPADPPADGGDQPPAGGDQPAPVDPPTVPELPDPTPPGPAAPPLTPVLQARAGTIHMGAPLARRGRLGVLLTCSGGAACSARISLYERGRRKATYGPYSLAAGQRRRIWLHAGAAERSALKRHALKLRLAGG